jgi:ribosome-associated protein
MAVQPLTQSRPARQAAPHRKPKRSLTDFIHQALHDKKAEDVAIVSLVGKSSLADALVIATGTSERHLDTLARHVMSTLTDEGYDIYATDGLNQSDWVIVDVGDVIVHLFLSPARERYNLEKMWSVAF